MSVILQKRDLPRGQVRVDIRIEAEPERAPDLGPTRPGKVGATAIGARAPLVAFNVYPSTGDVEIPKAIARAVRGSRPVLHPGPGLAGQRVAQVSMNLTHYQQMPIHRVMEMIRREPARYACW